MKEKHLLERNGMVILCALFCTALWGSAFPCVKLGYAMFSIPSGDTANQILFAGLRFFGAGILALLMGSAGQKKILIPKKASWWKIIVLSFFQTSIQYFLFYVGMAHTTGVKGSILQGTSVLFSLLIVCLIFHTEKLTGLKVLGCIIGFAGIVLVNFTGAGMDLQFSFLGEGFLLLSTLSGSFSAAFIKEFSKSENPVTLSAYQFMFGGLMLIGIGTAMGGHLQGFTAASTALLVYMMFISAAAYSLWGMLLKHNPVSKITVFGFTIEIFGVLFSTWILKEGHAFGLQTLAALVLVCIGIILVNKTRRRTS